MTVARRPARAVDRARRAARVPALDWVLMLAVARAPGRSARLLVWSATSHRDDLTGGDPHGVPEASSWSTSPSAWCCW